MTAAAELFANWGRNDAEEERGKIYAMTRYQVNRRARQSPETDRTPGEKKQWQRQVAEAGLLPCLLRNMPRGCTSRHLAGRKLSDVP